jgi:hypothetical protein
VKLHRKRTTHRERHAKIVGAFVLFLLAVIISFVAYHFLATRSDSGAPRKNEIPSGVQQVTLRIGCGGCGKPCTSRTSGCPQCPDKLESGATKLGGVESATFKAVYASGNATIKYNASLVSLTTIESQIEQTPPYPSCCTGITLLTLFVSCENLEVSSKRKTKPSRDVSARRPKIQDRGKIPWGYVLLALVILVVILGLVYFQFSNYAATTPGYESPPPGNLDFPFSCLSSESLFLHIHPWLTIRIRRSNQILPYFH